MKSAYSTIPNKTCVIRNKDKPWMRNNIRTEMRKRRSLHRVAKRDNTPASWATYIFQRNKVISLVHKAKNRYYSSVSHDLTNQSASTKQWWRLIFR